MLFLSLPFELESEERIAVGDAAPLVLVEGSFCNWRLGALVGKTKGTGLRRARTSILSCVSDILAR